MSDAWAVLQLFPENGLDRSLHAPVFIGLILLSFFRETLGWTFAGLVVPGYLATVLVAAPVTGALVVTEAILTYVGALVLGRLMPRTGAWFTFFGRERFLLLIACASLVRLAIEGGVLPALVQRWDLTHSRELYSLGLVLVPLLGNSFWNAGFVRAFPRIALVTGVTYLVVAEVLLPYTNFTLSRFQVANESVSLAFLESPHAHIILLIGAILGARNNVRYGWDYNGILVPALLAVAWYQPTKVATTITEGLVVYLVSVGLVKVRPFSRLMIVGSRRVLLTFSVGFAIKYVSGVALVTWLPHMQLIDFFGFGYLLPSLLANKMWDRGSIANVLMPTLQVSIMAFPLGTLIGFGLRSISPAAAVAAPDLASQIEMTQSVPWALTLGDTAPSPHQSGTGLKLVDGYGVAMELVRHSREGAVGPEALGLARRGLLKLAQPHERGWLVATPRADDPNADGAGPRFALRTAKRYGDRWLLLVAAPEVGSPAFAVAYALAERIGARAIVVTSRVAAVATRDEEFGQQISEELQLDRTLRISIGDRATSATLSAVGSLPKGLTTSLLQEVLGHAVSVSWRSAEAADDSALGEVELRLPSDVASAVAASTLGEQPLGDWSLSTHQELAARLRSLSFSNPRSFRVPSVPELRLYGSLVKARLANPGPPTPWQRALAGALGLQFAQISGAFDAWVLYEAEGAQRRGDPTLVQRARSSTPASGVALTLAAPRWQHSGTIAAARLYEAFDADLLLVHGALVSVASDGSADPRRPQGRQSFFQRAHETWLNAGGHTVMLRGIAATRPSSTDAVAAFDAEVTELVDGPTWTRPLLGTLLNAGVSLEAVDGTAERAGLEASQDPSVNYARRFAIGRSMVLWLTTGLRADWSGAQTAAVTERRLAASAVAPYRGTLEALLESKSGCSAGSATVNNCAPSTKAGSASCPREQSLRQLVRYQMSRNPHFLALALELGSRCGWATLRADQSATTWLLVPTPSSETHSTRQQLLAVPLLGSSRSPDLVQSGWPQVNPAGFKRLAPIALQPLWVALP